MSDDITSHRSHASVSAVKNIPSVDAVGLADSSLDSHSLVGLPLCAVLPFTVSSHFSVRCVNAVCACRFSSGVMSSTLIGLKHAQSCA